MPNLTFDQLSAKIQAAFAEQTYQEGMALANQYLDDFPKEQPLLNYWRMCFAARLEETELACDILDATLSAGIWYSDTLLRQSPSLEPLQDHDEFNTLATVSEKMRANDVSDQTPLLVIRPQEGCGPEDKPCPTVFFLHGNTDNAQKNALQWAELANQGWLLALPQSKQAMWADAYFWSNFEAAAPEIEGHYQKLTKQYAINPQETLLAGFSMGGEIALALALSGKIPCAGFVLLGPGGPMMDDLDSWRPFIDSGHSRGLRGTIIMGDDDDTIPQDNIRQLVDLFNNNGIPCELHTVPGLHHEYPEDFGERIQTAIKFILG